MITLSPGKARKAVRRQVYDTLRVSSHLGCLDARELCFVELREGQCHLSCPLHMHFRGVAIFRR